MDIRTATLLCTFCLPQAALAAEPAGDEIIVTGRRIRYELRLQKEAAERAVYDLFNELNDEPRFQISCEMRAITGTIRKVQMCQTEFERRALSLEGQDYLAAYRAFRDELGGEPYTTAATSAMIIAPQQRELRRKMQEVAKTHPEFVDALVRFVDVKGRYDRSRGITPDEDETNE